MLRIVWMVKIVIRMVSIVRINVGIVSIVLRLVKLGRMVKKLARTYFVFISDIDRHFFPDPSSSISDRLQIGQTGSTHSLLYLAVLQ